MGARGRREAAGALMWSAAASLGELPLWPEASASLPRWVARRFDLQTEAHPRHGTATGSYRLPPPQSGSSQSLGAAPQNAYVLSGVSCGTGLVTMGSESFGCE